MTQGPLIPAGANYAREEPATVSFWDIPEVKTSSSLHLAVGEVHLWLAAMDQPEGGWRQAFSWLDEAEKDQTGRFARDRERRCFICRRGILRKILSLYLDMAPPALRFRYGPHGKPYLASPIGDGELEFSCSHSHDAALYAFSRGRRIGVDLERLTGIPEAEEIAVRQLSPQWAALWRRLPPDQKNLVFLRWWTQTEAYLKAVGEGWADQGGDPGIVGLFFPGEGHRRWSDSHRPGGPWSGEVFFPASGYVAAVAVEGPEISLPRVEQVAPERPAACANRFGLVTRLNTHFRHLALGLPVA